MRKSMAFTFLASALPFPPPPGLAVVIALWGLRFAGLWCELHRLSPVDTSSRRSSAHAVVLFVEAVLCASRIRMSNTSLISLPYHMSMRRQLVSFFVCVELFFHDRHNNQRRP